MAAGRAFELFLILVLVSGCLGTDPCTDYEFIWMEFGRRSSEFNSMGTTTRLCDESLIHGTWHRFEHDAGNRLIESPVDPWYCGTQAPIWMNGTHPTDTTEKTALVCATYTPTNFCAWNGTVRIRLCNESGSEYFVYQLPVPPGCPIAYCVDAESRKQCVPPDVWLVGELRCGENITTTPGPPTTPSTSTGTPGTDWSTWESWSDCSKPCDYGVQTRSRKCDEMPCTGDATGEQKCAQFNCEELPEEKDKGIVLSLLSEDATQDTMLTVVSNQPKIDTILMRNINSICSQNASLCCGFNLESNSSKSDEFVMSDDIYAAKGFPKPISGGTVHYKPIAEVNEAANQAICINTMIHVKVRQVRSTYTNFIPFEVMVLAAENSQSEILRETGLIVEDYFDPATYPADSQGGSSCPVDTCIVPIVVCCVVIPAIAIVVGCIVLHMMKKSKTTPRPTDSKDPNIAAPTMVHPHVNSGQVEKGGLPGKPS